MPDLNNLSFLTSAGIVAAAAAVGAFWSQARNFFQYLSGFVLLQKTLDRHLSGPVSIFLRSKYKKLPSGLSSYTCLIRQLDNESLASEIPFDMPNAISLWWGEYGIFLVKAQDASITLVSLRGLSSPKKLVISALEDERARTKNTSTQLNRFHVNRIVGTASDSMSFGSGNTLRRSSQAESSPSPAEEASYWSTPRVDIDRSFMYEPERYRQDKSSRDPMRSLFYPPEVHTLLEGLKQWYAREKWYNEHSIPWRTGVLLHGPGGTGKSSFARVVAQTLGVPLSQFFLATLTDKEFIHEWECLPTPCVVALEDIDTVFHGRESITPHKSLSFECVLNQISGLSSLGGVLLIVTTNNLDKIDPALGQLDSNGRPTRPGRIDHILHMGKTTEDQRRNIARQVLDRWAEDSIEVLVQEGSNTTAAQFQASCVALALSRLADTDAKKPSLL